ncbi:DUF1552 domain-containing protein [Polyangium aurulentum]|uniref:DUF1552 domain-containing protein n=1 Tax=Polyangium aurulentum TaxID=2567896 RepID=UPI0010AE1804|nr:DUF1552 domain-containing protein [Polyangium aurulentum]UQA56874.1 DUF1552 domain-containing protein [Polyangium aurulentum]
MSGYKTSRRSFLRAGLAGGALVATGSAITLFPWLQAAAAPAPKRLLLFFTPHGTVWDQWRPGGGESDFTFSPILEPLAGHRERLVIVDGIEIKTGTEYYIPHTYTMPVLWTGSPIDTATKEFCREDHMQCFGWNTGVSVDQFIASKLTGTPTPFSTIELGLGCGGLHPATRMIYTGPGKPRSPIDNPEAAFSTLFGAVNPDLQQAERDAKRRKSVLDSVLDDFGSRRAKLSQNEKLRLDAHADSIRELELSLTAACAAPPAPVDVNSETSIDRQSDLLATALGCGLTRIASFQVRIADNDNTLYPWVGLDAGGHHTLSHDSGPAAQGKLAQLYRWYSQRFAYLLDKLAATPDVDGRSVLDNTLVIWGSELGQAWNHDIENVPFVFAGAKDLLRGGRYLKGSAIAHNRMLVSACHAMGLTDVETYGTLDTGTGPLPGLFL